MDTFTSIVALSTNQSLIEGNPPVNYILDKYGFPGLVIAKMGYAMAQITIIEGLRRSKITSDENVIKAGNLAMQLSNIAFAAVCIHNALMLF